MIKPIKKYFVCANTCKGFINCFPSNLSDMDRVYILKGGPGTGKSTLMKKVGEYFVNKNEDVEYIYCSSDTTSLDGVILRSKRIAVVDGTAPHVAEPTIPGAVEEYVNLGAAWNREKLKVHKSEIREISTNISEKYKLIYNYLAQAKNIHDRMENIYLENINFDILNNIADDLTSEILPNMALGMSRGKQCYRFFGALTPSGSVNYIENLTEDMKLRIFIKGRPGTGKSTILKKLASKATEAGFDVEAYPCAFDPDSLDMIILPELKIAVFDSTEPHELFPSRETDIILDIYSAAVTPGTDENNAEAISIIKNEYNEKISAAKTLLADIRSLHDKLEAFYIDAVDFKVINDITSYIISDIEQ